MTPENSKNNTVINHLRGLLAEDDLERLEKEGIIQQVSAEPNSVPSEEEVDESPPTPELPHHPPLENPQITSPKNLPELVRGFPRDLLKTVLCQRPPEAAEEERVPFRVNLPEGPDRSKRMPRLPGDKLRTRGDKLRVRSKLLVKESKAKGIREAVLYLAAKIPSDEIVPRAARRILRKKEQGNEESETKARSRIREDLRWFLKRLRPYQETKVYQVFGQQRKRREVKPKFENPEWRKTYGVILKHFGSLSVYEFMLQLDTLLPKGYSYL